MLELSPFLHGFHAISMIITHGGGAANFSLFYMGKPLKGLGKNVVSRYASLLHAAFGRSSVVNPRNRITIPADCRLQIAQIQRKSGRLPG